MSSQKNNTIFGSRPAAREGEAPAEPFWESEPQFALQRQNTRTKITIERFIGVISMPATALARHSEARRCENDLQLPKFLLDAPPPKLGVILAASQGQE
jgi:hypothetical protein